MIKEIIDEERKRILKRGQQKKKKEKKSDNLDDNEKEPLINMKGKRKSTIIWTMMRKIS